MTENTPTKIMEFNVQSLTFTTYTQYQNTLLLRMIAYLQNDIKAVILDMGNELKQPPFTPAEMSERIRHRQIPLCVLEPHRGHHQRARLDLIRMSKMSIHIPYYDKKKEIKYSSYKQLFNVSFMKKGNKIMAMFDFSTDLLYYYHNASMGYHKLDLDEMFSFRQNATRNMYRLYYGHYAFAKTQMTAIKLGALLSKKMDFKSCSEIIKDIVQPAKEEMDNAYYAGRCSIHFDYELEEIKHSTEDWKNNDCGSSAKKSVKRKIIITFYTREDDNPTGQRKYDLEQFQAKIRTTLIHAWGVNDKVALDISQKVKVWMLPTLDELLYNKSLFAKKLRDSGKPIKNEAGFIVRQIGKYFEEHIQKKEKNDKKGEKKYPIPPKDSLF